MPGGRLTLADGAPLPARVEPQEPLDLAALARLRLDVLDEPALAADNLEHALALRPPPALAEDVRARLVEAYGRANEPHAACDAARIYRAQFPRGRREALVARFCPRELGAH